MTLPQAAQVSATTNDRAAVVLAAGHDDASRELITRPLGDATVVQLAVANVRKIVADDHIVVVVAPGDTTVRGLLGEGLRYVEQRDLPGTGGAVLAARAAVEALGTPRARSSWPTPTPRSCAPSPCWGS